MDSIFLQAIPDLFFSPRSQILPLSLQQTCTYFTEKVYTGRIPSTFLPQSQNFTSFSLILKAGEEFFFFFTSVSPTFLLHFHSSHVMLCFSLLRLCTDNGEQIHKHGSFSPESSRSGGPTSFWILHMLVYPSAVAYDV